MQGKALELGLFVMACLIKNGGQPHVLEDLYMSDCHSSDIVNVYLKCKHAAATQ